MCNDILMTSVGSKSISNRQLIKKLYTLEFVNVQLDFLSYNVNFVACYIFR